MFLFVITCYSIALALETTGLVSRLGRHRIPALVCTIAGALAQTYSLVLRLGETAAPLDSPAEWCLVSSLALVCVMIVMAFASPRHPFGVFLLPLVLLLIGVSRVVSDQPFAPERASLFWGQVHGWLLLLATVVVSVGFLAGLMYFIQSWRLKHKLPPATRFQLPSLERLERINGSSLGISALLVAGGFVSGLILSQLQHADDGIALWRDPLVISLTIMLLWLLTAEIFRWVYPAARRGQKVAYLTVASSVFLAIVLGSMIFVGAAHGSPKGSGVVPIQQGSIPHDATGSRPIPRPSLGAFPS